MSSKEKILDSTYQILQEEGYSGLSIRKISDRADIDKSMIYHHFESKTGLIKAFLDKLSVEVEREHQEIIETPKEELLDQMLSYSFIIGKQNQWELEKAFLEIQAQASKNEELSKKLQELDSAFVDMAEEAFKQIGVDNPRDTAEIYVSLVQGSIGRKAASQDKKGLKKLRKETEKIIKARIKNNTPNKK